MSVTPSRTMLADTRPGSSAVHASAYGPPDECPATRKRLIPSASASAATSEGQSAIDRPGCGDDLPYPGRSGETTRIPSARNRCSRYARCRRLIGAPWKNRTQGQSGSPISVYASSRPPVTATRESLIRYPLDRGRVGPGLDRPRAGGGAGLVQDRLTGTALHRVDLVDLATNLGDRCADRVRDAVVLRPEHRADPGDGLVEQHAPTADQDDRHRLRAGLHLVDRRLDRLLDRRQRPLDQRPVQVTLPSGVAHLGQAGRDGDVRGGQPQAP